MKMPNKRKLKARARAKSSPTAEPPQQQPQQQPLQALAYRVNSNAGAALRQLFLKADPKDGCCLSVANIPPCLLETHVEALLEAVASTASSTVNFKRTTALDGDCSTGYRSGTATFIDAKTAKRVLNKCESIKEPLVLDALNAAPLPKMGIQKYVDAYNAQFSYEESKEPLNAVEEAEAEVEVETAVTRKRKQFNAGEWITVTRSDKSFRAPVVAPGAEKSNIFSKRTADPPNKRKK